MTGEGWNDDSGQLQGVHRLMDIGRRDGEYPVSRDWEDIDCKATGCRYNSCEKCMVPSRCKIGPTGQCEGFESALADCVKKRPIDGD